MKLDELLKQQEKRGLKQKKIKANMQSYEDYAKNDSSPRPYNTKNVSDLNLCDSILTNSIRDTESNASTIAIKDTESNALTIAIIDTESNASTIAIRDTESNASTIAIRDTESNASTIAIKDTESNASTIAIRDTESNSSTIAIKDTKDTDVTNHRDEANLFGRPPKAKIYNYVDLTGNAKKLVDEIARKCAALWRVETPYIEKNVFSEVTGVNLGTIKTTIYRLKERGVITDYEATKGRKSSWKFFLSESIFSQYISVQRGDKIKL